MDKRICYCFGYTEEDIVNDLREHNGISTIMRRILREKQQGGCGCRINHPLGR